MKAKHLCFARIGLAILIGGLVPTWNLAELRAKAEVDLSIGLNIHSPADFYNPLAALGSWVDVGHYGRCWRPPSVAAGWRPYTMGHWEWTDAGWYWVSDEPWAWACYHYGSWVFDPAYGWVWIPGTEWAPAWVVWREAPDYIGWAPCGPGGVAVGASFFTFVDVHHFHDRLEPRELVFNDSQILRRSRPIGDFRRETRDFDGARRRIVINQGPGVDPIQRATGTRFAPRPVYELARQTPVPEAVRRNLQPGIERPRMNQEQAPSRTGREPQRLYREAPPSQPPPTGRQEQRIYREPPSRQPAPQPNQTPAEQPRSSFVPERSAPPVAPQERPLPPTGFERGRNEGQVPRREESTPRVAPAPPQRPAPPAQQGPPLGREREKDRDGQ